MRPIAGLAAVGGPARPRTGGVKSLGFGKDMSQEAVGEYSVTRHLMIKHAAPSSRDSFRPA
jgi:betaine-aldehyde dehydrogenase